LQISAICLQETWLADEYAIYLFHVDGYTLICQGGKICSSHAGIAIYCNICEGQYLEITCYNMKKHIILGNIQAHERCQ